MRLFLFAAASAVTISLAAQQAAPKPELAAEERVHMRAIVAESLANRQAFMLARQQAEKTDADLRDERAKLIQSIVSAHPGSQWVDDETPLTGHLEPAKK